MPDQSSEYRVAVLAARWGNAHDEPAFVLRSVAASLARAGEVDVLSPGEPGTVRPDGAFDVRAVGASPSGDWPAPASAVWPDCWRPSLAVFDHADRSARALLSRFTPGTPTAAVVANPTGVGLPSNGAPGEGAPRQLVVGYGGETGGTQGVGLHVPVHPMAKVRSHVGLGFTGYLLVLSDRGPGTGQGSDPTPLAAWLAARFGDRHVVVVEDGVASVWRWRSLRGLVAINTRADLWRLVAHARATVDLAPGRLIARECVESLRYGVPIVAPAGTVAAQLAAGGGGLWFRSPAELLACVEMLDDESLRYDLGEQGQALADRWYGDAHRFDDRVRAAVRSWLS